VRSPRRGVKLNPEVRAVGAWRRWAVMGVLLAGSGTVLARAFELQVLDNEFLQREGNKRAVRTLEVPAHRGAIRDRNGEPLALSAPVESIWVVPRELLEQAEYIAPLAKLVGMRETELRAFLEARKTRQFVYLKRHMAPSDAERVLALKAPGVSSQREYSRFYPAGEVAGNLVGFTNIDGIGQEGMEAAQQDLLSGTPGSRRVIRARDGRIVEDGPDFKPAESGEDLSLTIDLRLQYLAYRELKAAVQAHKAKGGLMVVVDTVSGEVLAIANQPSFNPNRLEDRTSNGMRNRAVTDVFEPGSTVKPLLLAEGIETGLVDPNEAIDTRPGYWMVAGHTVRDTHDYGVVDLSRMLVKSSNVAAAKIGLRMGAEEVYRGFEAFGFGQPLYSGFPGESMGVFRDWRGWGSIETATAAFGYGISVTALHLVRAYSGLANDGLMPQITFIKDSPTIPPQRAVSAETASAVRYLMEGVTNQGGTGTRAAVNGYRVAGKTGTVHKPIAGGYAENKYQGVFIGMLPAEHPRLVGLVMIDEPSEKGYYGGLTAAPVFARVMQAAARLLQIAPDQTPEQQTASAQAAGARS